MTTYRVTYFFEGFQASRGFGQSHNYGWTENWYRTIDGTLDTILRLAGATGANDWISLRRAFLHRMYAITAIRVVDVDNPRRSKLVFVNFGGTEGVRLDLVVANTAPGELPAQVTCALLVDLVRLPGQVGEVSHHRRIMLRGLAAGAIFGNVLSGVLEYQQPINKFLRYVGRIDTRDMTGGAIADPAAVPVWEMRFKDPVGGAAEYVSAVTNPAGNNRHILVTADLGAVSRGQRFRIARTREPRGLARVWTVLENSAGPPYLMGTAKREVTGTYDGSGQASLVSYLYGPATQYNLVGMRTRKTGGPFAHTRGRRSSQG